MHYFPITFAFFLVFALLFIFLFVLIEVGILQYAYDRIGIKRRHMFALLILSLLGSYVKMPIDLAHKENVPSNCGGYKDDQEAQRAQPA